MPEDLLMESLLRYIGQTVTIFTTSGGVSGCGFTGTLAGVTNCTVRLITDIGAPPACPVGSACCNSYGNSYGFGGGYGGGYGGGFAGNWLGSITEIPICKIASFTHNAI